MNASESTVDNGEVARRAYEIWESRGCPPGDGMDDWNAAMAELLASSTEEQAPAEYCSVQSRLPQIGETGGIRVWFARVKRKLIGHVQ